MRCLGVFAQAPIPGRVQPRLAEDVGPSTAAEVHWQIGRRIVSQVAGSGYRTTVWFRPPSEGPFIREWLDGLGRVDLRPQAGGTLGDRLAHAFARHFADGARRTIILAGDCPGVDRRLVTEAFTALSACDVVLGPTPAGGCYLIGLNEPHPVLFRGLPGTAAAPLAQAKARAVGAGLRLRLLRPLREVRTVQDARVLGLLKSHPTIERD